MTKRALIFDCDGVIADTERDGHRVAFNATFDDFELPLHWSDDEYAQLVSIGGGKERMTSVLTPALKQRLGLETEAKVAEAVARWHESKSKHFRRLVSEGAIPGRPGVRRLVEEALSDGWKVAVASTSAYESVSAVLAHTVGPDLAAAVDIYAGDVVPNKKPAPDIYLHALSDLGVTPERAVVIEDSGIGNASAVAAGLPVIVTVSAYTRGDDFSGAAIVLSDLGEEGRPAKVHSNPWNLELSSAVVQVDMLNQIILANTSMRIGTAG